MKILIENAENGVIVTAIDGDFDGTKVFETEDYSGNENFDARTALLWHLVDRLGWYGSKHDEKRIRINIETKEK